MTYFEKNNVQLNTLKKEDGELLTSLILKDSDILFYYDLPLIFILSSEKNPNIKFLGYMFSSIDDEVLKYYLLEKTNKEVEDYLSNKLDLHSFLNIGTDLEDRRLFIENIGSDFVQVSYLDRKTFDHTLSLIKPDLFYKK